MLKLLKGENKKITVTTILMCLLEIALGVLLHFAYEWSGENFFVALFSGVNESTWEHLKLLFMPFIFTLIIEYFIYGKDVKNYFSAKLFGIISGMLFIVIAYYTITGAFGKAPDFINIAIYVLAAIIAYGYALCRMTRDVKIGGGLFETLSIILFAVIMGAFFIFTYYPPHIPLFADPINGKYSIYA